MTCLKKVILGFGLIVLLQLYSSAQIAASLGDFAGTWLLENKDKYKQRTLVISVSGNAVNLRESFFVSKEAFDTETLLFADNRGEKNLLTIPGMSPASEVRSTTSWKKGRLIRRLSYSLTSGNGFEKMFSDYKSTDEYSISNDGTTLKFKSQIFIERSVSPETDRKMRKGGVAINPAPQVTVFERKYKKQN